MPLFSSVGFPALGIEPWTFEQKLGEAVFIPAGCPHQVRNLKVWQIFTFVTIQLNFYSCFGVGSNIMVLTDGTMSICAVLHQSCAGLCFSPENVGECIKLTGEFRRLPSSHRANEDKLEVSINCVLPVIWFAVWYWCVVV